MMVLPLLSAFLTTLASASASSSPTDVCPPASLAGSVTRVGGAHFLAGEERVDFARAVDFCAGLNLTLAPVGTPAEFVRAALFAGELENKSFVHVQYINT